MAIKGVRTIAEYQIRRWMIEHDFDMEYFTVTMDGSLDSSRATVTDLAGNVMRLEYDSDTKAVSELE